MDPAQLRVEMEKYHVESYGWARSCCSKHPSEAEDILQMAYLKVLSGKARFDGHSAFKTWLFSVIRRTAADERRKHFLRRLMLFRYGEQAESSPGEWGNGFVEDQATIESLCRQALSDLSRRQREVLQLVFYHDMTVQEAAVVMRVGIGSARTHYERGKERFRQWMSKSEIAHEMEWRRREHPATVS